MGQNKEDRLCVKLDIDELEDVAEVEVDLEDQALTISYGCFPNFGNTTLVELNVEDFKRLADMFNQAYMLLSTPAEPND
ncbi:MAG: hypothetical protein ACFFBD_27795 [Candidatus Hodarchaeota archaeon]